MTHCGRFFILLACGLAAPANAGSEVDRREIALEEGETLEEEVDFDDEEEIGADGTGFIAILPDHDYEPWLLVLPAFLLLLFVWNVRWRRVQRHPRLRRGEKRRRVKGRRPTGPLPAAAATGKGGG